MGLLEHFKKNAAALGLAADGSPALLAVSGGVDSMVLAHLFQAAGLPFGIAHCNFQLRGEESDGDAVFVEKTAAEWGVYFFVKRFKTATYATHHGVSIQMAARDLRYAWFSEICREHGFARLATAHHLNDAVETMLLNWVRGTGLRGMSNAQFSMSNVQIPTPQVPPSPVETPVESGNFKLQTSNSQLFRPLSSTPRADIEAYARAHNIAWREDLSNASDDYARNFVRHHVVPLLTELNPNFLNTTERNMRRLGEVRANYEWLLEKHFGSNTDISKSLLRDLPAPRQALHELLRPYGFTEEQCRQLADNLDHIGLELHSGLGWRALNDRGKIIVAPPDGSELQTSNFKLQTISENDLMVSLPDGSRLVLMPSEPQPPFPDGRDAVLVDAAQLQFPLTLRAWQPGDWFQPFGMGGQRQKLQDLFVNQKLTRFDKERAWVLENGDGAIVWVVGHRLDERFRVTGQTERGLKIGLA